MEIIWTAFMPRAVSSLESHLGYWLRAVSNQVSGAFARTVGTCVGPTRSPADSKRRLADGGSSRTVAAEFGVSASTVRSIGQGKTWAHVE